MKENKENAVMKNMTLEHIASACKGTYYGPKEEKDRLVAGVVLDSRKVEKDFCFIAAKGKRTDGHKFIADVLEQGAACVVCETLPEERTGCFILVEDSFQALKEIAEYYRMQIGIPVVGITGSVGKTSTKEFIAGVLEQKYRVLKTEGNFNNEVGVPLTLLRIREEHEIAVLEMGINHFGEMHRLSKMAKPDTCVMTNIGECHLEFLKSREGVLRAKSEIFDYISEKGRVYINGDDNMLRTIQVVRNKKPITFGLGRHNTYYADEITDRGINGCDATIHTENDSFRVSVRLPGRHMIQNALAAAAVAEQYGLTREEIIKGIQSAGPVEGRSNIVKKGSLTLIDDSYNANPVSVKAALELLGATSGKTIAILGDMFELGEKEAELHEEVGAYAVQKKINCLICVGKLSKYMYQGACKEKERTFGNTAVLYYESPEECLHQIGKYRSEFRDLTILIKASHGMNFSWLAERIK